jgi:hypothetical protein
MGEVKVRELLEYPEVSQDIPQNKKDEMVLKHPPPNFFAP